MAKLLNELSVGQRDDAVKSLAYEAESRMRDPVYGCVGFISLLQQRLRQIQTDLHNAKKELSTYVSPQAMQVLLANPGMLQSSGVLTPHLQQSLFNNTLPQVMVGSHGGGGGGGQMVIRDPQQHEIQLEAQQMQHIHQQQVMLRNYEQQQEFMKFNGGLEENGGGFGNQVDQLLSPSLALGGFENVGSYHLQQQGQEEQHNPIEAHLLLSAQEESHENPHQQPCESENGRSIVPA